jgi:MFS family permease
MSMEKASSIDHVEHSRKLSTPAEVASALQHVDDKSANTVKNTLEHSRQGGYVPRTPEEKHQHRSLNRKLDLFVLPFCVFIYLFNGLDRSNIGNAQTDGFTDDLGISSNAINTATSLFFCTFVPLQPVSAAVGKRVGQAYFLAVISFCWGILTLCQAFIKTEAQLIAVRLLIGVFESGFYPTCVSYLSLFYPRFDLAFRIALFYGSYAIAGAFGGLIAYGCFHINGKLHGWQYLFILEGSLTIIVAMITPFWLKNGPQHAWFLSAEEREYADRRMVIDAAANLNSAYKLSSKDIWEAVKDWKLWAVLPFNVLASVAPQGFTIFFPIVVKVRKSIVTEKSTDSFPGARLLWSKCQSHDSSPVRHWHRLLAHLRLLL